jgi:hypothetical protein
MNHSSNHTNDQRLLCGERPQSRNSRMPVNSETTLLLREVSNMAYNKSSPGIYEQNAAKHTLAYAIWNGLMDRAEISDARTLSKRCIGRHSEWTLSEGVTV